ncbi:MULTISPECIES: 4-hydroxy-tetrahydrodipicolinate synthase [unclassified Arsukibacterium]|uniref:4-hydroxy-tetrahydrodipicolinate synthase n=1 Tax=unclassified Arsukibacterium TaxID=2635278 RepID=UPI000C41A299|nr:MULTISPECIES: 4-hydroxy-tetrahydrodipicolinate synthase [unclassified Arsukibacterium]MAA94730.1 4-hydroxy-tetrahydrodipicolinate synthase [Rheinheimera sp.]MBM33912.1 4-hydroxy-tetrahydrodipicolinate synthase [Rheinheimera sp.]HAW93719.1 4-hydroxy-tetrahydrodipicolinate synthase [Candidatus Azambacteria bacterium]|tara:strand:+ start:41206 stop:42087 length:882 start_codon:yes stop_codon:yes gene_type:complete
MFSGSFVALVTPMLPDGEIDYKGLEQLVSFHLQQGTDGLVIMGTTAEAATISFTEQLEIIGRVASQVSGQIPVLAGNGTNATAEGVLRTRQLDKLAIDGFLTVTPFYNKPMQKGLLAHFKQVAAATAKPLLLYNVPGRTGVDLLPETVAELAMTDNIVGIKEATGSLTRLAELQQHCGAGFALLSGDDATSLDFMQAGGHGVISVTANVVPALLARLCSLVRTGRTEEARTLDNMLQGLHHKLFIESNPIPTKWALQRMALIDSDFMRLPLTQLEPIHHDTIEQALRQAGLQL